MALLVAPMPAATEAMPFLLAGLESRIVTDPTNPQFIRKDVKLYNGTGGALTAGGLYEAFVGGTARTDPNPRVKAIGASAGGRPRLYCVALAATAAATWDWFAVYGNVQALVDGDTNDVAAGDYLKPVASSVNLVLDHATVPTAACVGAAHGANGGTAALTWILLAGNFAVI